MAYRKTRRSAETLAKMRAGKDRARMARTAPDYPPGLPDLRRRLVVEDFDFGHCVHVLEFYRTRRVECYRVLAGLRKAMPRLGAQ